MTHTGTVAGYVGSDCESCALSAALIETFKVDGQVSSFGPRASTAG